MRSRWRWIALCGVALALLVGWSAGCTPEDPNPKPPARKDSSLTYYGKIKPILDTHCGGCHTSKGIGPFNLTDYDQLLKVKMLVKSSIESRSMPPWQADDSCAPYLGSIGLPSDKAKEVLKWIEEGTAKGDPSSYKAPPPPPKWGLDRVDATLEIKAPYTPSGKRSDDYRCFVLDWPFKETKYVRGYRVVPGNKSIVHHVIAYHANPQQAAHFVKKDQAEEGPGYTCYGGPGGESGFLAGWAPGGRGGKFPAGTGIKVVAGSKIVVQVHYNVSTNAPAPDQSSIEFQVADKVDKEARTQPFANPSWTRGAMPIPAGQPKVLHQFKVDLAGLYGRSIDIHTASLHMHVRGKSGKLKIIRKDGGETCLLHIPKWDFNWQRPYAFQKPIQLEPGDQLSIQCTFDNSAANQPLVNGKRQAPVDLNWGEGTNDEMCVGFFYMTNSD